MGVLRTLRLPETLASTPLRVEHPSLTLITIQDQLIQPGKTVRVLDLGPALGANIDYYSQFAKKIHIEDLFEAVISMHGEERSQRKLMSELFPYRDEVRFDLILCWDLLNYLSPDEINALSAHLQRFAGPGTILSTIMSVRKELPTTPLHFRICPNQKISYQMTCSEEVSSPRYSKTELTKFLGNFKRSRSMLLRNGYEEQIYCKI